MRPVPRVDPLRCAPSARRRGDPLLATAAPATRWLLIEQPGAWGRDALHGSVLGSGLATALLDMTSGLGVRVQAIRRPTDGPRPAKGRRWAYVDSRAVPPTSWWGQFSENNELLDLSLDGSEGIPSTDPILLVCTHGRHDACCALLGRPVFSALAERYPDQTWETSHVGGDRFAANVVILPTGLYYGGLDTETVIAVISASLAGRIDPTHFRGASVQPAPMQAAEHYLRAHLGEHRITGVMPIALRQLEVSRWTVRLAHVDGSEFDVEVSSTHSPALNRLTCSAGHPAASRVFDLVSLRNVLGPDRE